MDLNEGYDLVRRSRLSEVFASYGVASKSIAINKRFEDGIWVCVWWDNSERFNQFGVEPGLRQRRVLPTPLLDTFCFALIDKILKRCSKNSGIYVKFAQLYETPTLAWPETAVAKVVSAVWGVW